MINGFEENLHAQRALETSGAELPTLPHVLGFQDFIDMMRIPLRQSFILHPLDFTAKLISPS